MCNQNYSNWAFDELINKYEIALIEARNLWLYYCEYTDSQVAERIKKDEKKMKEFISICNKLKG